VRDFVMGVVPDDYDIVTSALPNQVMALFKRTVAIGAKFGVVAVIEEGHSYEVATFRSDDVYIDGRRPSQVHFSSAKEDVFRRDFTVNGLLMDPVTGEITDYVDGLADIREKIIRTIGDPNQRFQEDHLRMLRAIRFTANLNFNLDSSTQEAIAKNVAEIKTISAERLCDELSKLLTRGGARRGLELMAQTGMMREILPEVDALQGVDSLTSATESLLHALPHTLPTLLKECAAQGSKTGKCLSAGKILTGRGRWTYPLIRKRPARFWKKVKAHKMKAAQCVASFAPLD